MSTFNKLENTIAADDALANAQTKKILALMTRALQRNSHVQFLSVDDIDIYNEFKRQVTGSSPISTIPAGHIIRS